MTPGHAILLGLVQALTEFLPISSDGHLALTEAVLGLTSHDGSMLFFDVSLHAGTLLAVVVVLRRDLAALARGSVSGLRAIAGGEAPRLVLADCAPLKTVLVVTALTVPTGIIGLGLKKLVEDPLRGPAPVAGMLLLTAAILVVTAFVPRGTRVEADLGWRDALAIGIAQGLAVLPGLSRSGSTIAVALVGGVRPDVAARLSFIASIPAVAGALLVELKDVSSVPSSLVTYGALGATVSFVVGVGALKLLLRIVELGRFHWFAPYLVCVAAATLMWLR